MNPLLDLLRGIEKNRFLGQNVGYVLDYRDYETDRRESGGNPLLSKPVEANRAQFQPRYFFATGIKKSPPRMEGWERSYCFG